MFRFYVLLCFQYIIVDSLIPGLSVRKTDKRLIARKRQDTLEMCRIFTEENEKIKNRVYDTNGNKKPRHRFRRVKRDVGDSSYAVNPTLNESEILRVESIVDRLYDDMEERGEKVKYRHLPTTAPENVKSRRFNFAPAELLGPLPTTTKHHRPKKDEDVKRYVKFPHGIIPYFIDPKTYDADLADIITKAFDYFEKATCIRLQRLRERPTDEESLKHVGWVYITNPSGIRQCVHSNERRKSDGVQMVVFGYDCMSLGDIAHEIMHILGFSHEHTRSDRDQYITIMWDNIKSGYKKYFEINSGGYQSLIESLPYDHASVLHYPPRAFSKNGQVTILTQPGTKIGQREGLSEIDIEKVALVYSTECVKRNRDYLLKTCPTVVKPDIKYKNVTKVDIEKYFSDRLWPFGIVNYKLRDKMEFTTEERENINAVISHIEKETCIQFREISTSKDATLDDISNLSEQVTNNKNESQSFNNTISNIGSVSDQESTENSKTQNQNHDEISNKKIKQSENDIQQQEIETRKPHNEIKHSENEILLSDNEMKPISNKIASAESENEEENMRGLENPIIHLNPNQKLARLNFLRNKTVNSNYALKYKRFTVIRNNKPQKLNMTTEVKYYNKQSMTQNKRAKRSIVIPLTPRHATNIIVLTKSSKAGCVCPNPGRPNENKVLTISTDCFNSVNDLLHIFVHILGLDHQHNMYDRDSYLHIIWDNLTPDMVKEMKHKLPPEASVGFPYDYQSVMHYPWLQIKNGVTNIMYPIWNDGWAMGHWQGLSSTDVQKLNLLYFNECVARSKSMNTRFKLKNI